MATRLNLSQLRLSSTRRTNTLFPDRTECMNTQPRVLLKCGLKESALKRSKWEKKVKHLCDALIGDVRRHSLRSTTQKMDVYIILATTSLAQFTDCGLKDGVVVEEHGLARAVQAGFTQELRRKNTCIYVWDTESRMKIQDIPTHSVVRHFMRMEVMSVTSILDIWWRWINSVEERDGLVVREIKIQMRVM